MRPQLVSYHPQIVCLGPYVRPPRNGLPSTWRPPGPPNVRYTLLAPPRESKHCVLQRLRFFKRCTQRRHSKGQPEAQIVEKSMRAALRTHIIKLVSSFVTSCRFAPSNAHFCSERCKFWPSKGQLLAKLVKNLLGVWREWVVLGWFIKRFVPPPVAPPPREKSWIRPCPFG
jgi:hypothetical protein